MSKGTVNILMVVAVILVAITSRQIFDAEDSPAVMNSLRVFTNFNFVMP